VCTTKHPEEIPAGHDLNPTLENVQCKRGSRI